MVPHATALFTTAGGKGVVPSESSLFPKYCDFFGQAYRREQDFQAHKPEIAVLDAEEYWHLRCGGLSMPPRWPSWCCPRCEGEPKAQ